MSGNLRSRFTDFLTTDGEKPDRDRDSEFVDPPTTRDALMRAWEDGWTSVFAALEPLSECNSPAQASLLGQNLISGVVSGLE